MYDVKSSVSLKSQKDKGVSPENGAYSTRTATIDILLFSTSDDTPDFRSNFLSVLYCIRFGTFTVYFAQVLAASQFSDCCDKCDE